MARRQRRNFRIDVSPAAIEAAMQTFLAKGGKVTVLPPERARVPATLPSGGWPGARPYLDPSWDYHGRPWYFTANLLNELADD